MRLNGLTAEGMQALVRRGARSAAALQYVHLLGGVSLA